MTETPKPTGAQKFAGKLQEFYYLILWIFWIFIGLAFPILGMDLEWVGYVLIALGLIGAIAKCITMIKNVPVAIFIEAVDYLCLAILLAIAFVLSLISEGDLTWAFGVLAVISAALGITGLNKYMKARKTQQVLRIK